jgi:hypothetical protein
MATWVLYFKGLVKNDCSSFEEQFQCAAQTAWENLQVLMNPQGWIWKQVLIKGKRKQIKWSIGC